jgi:hypothetical protein
MPRFSLSICFLDMRKDSSFFSYLLEKITPKVFILLECIGINYAPLNGRRKDNADKR